MKMIQIIIIGFILSTAYPALARNWFSVPLGSQTALMGSAGIAFGRDGSMTLLNPANLARNHGLKLNFSTNVETYSEQKVTTPFTQDGVPTNFAKISGNTLENAEYLTIPSEMVVIFPLWENSVIAFSLLQPYNETRNFSGDMKVILPAIGNQTQLFEPTLFINNYDKYAGLSFAQRFKNLHIGVSGFGVLQSREVIKDIDDLYFSPISAQFEENRVFIHEEASSADFVPAIGLSYDIIFDQTKEPPAQTITSSATIPLLKGIKKDSVQKLSIGFSTRFSAIHLSGEYSASETQGFTDADDNSLLAKNQFSSKNYQLRIPLYTGLGFAYQHYQSFTLALDVGISFPVARYSPARKLLKEYTQLSQGDSPISKSEETELSQIKEQMTFNVHTGLEIMLTPSLSILSGVFYDPNTLSPLDKLDVFSSTFQQSFGVIRADTFGASLGFGFYNNNQIELLAGGIVSLSRGDFIGGDVLRSSEPQQNASGPRTISASLDNFEEKKVMLFISGGFSGEK